MATASTCVRASWGATASTLNLPNGTQLRLRRIDSNDRCGLAAWIALRAPESRRRRAGQGATIEHELALDPGTSQDIVELVRNWYAHYNRGNGEPSPDFWHEDAEYRTADEDPDAATHRGIDAIGRLFASWREVYPDLRAMVREAKASSDQVFAWVRFAGRGAASGVPVHMELAHVYTIRQGKAASLVEYTDRAEALEAVGL